MNAMSTRSPSAASAATLSTCLGTGTLSPVRADSSISSVAARMIRPSAGTRSPASTLTMSPGTISSMGISASSPPRRTLALTTIIFWRAATLADALPSWFRPIAALSSVSRMSMTPVANWPGDEQAQRRPPPAARSASGPCTGARRPASAAPSRPPRTGSGPYFAVREATSCGGQPLLGVDAAAGAARPPGSGRARQWRRRPLPLPRSSRRSSSPRTGLPSPWPSSATTAAWSASRTSGAGLREARVHLDRIMRGGRGTRPPGLAAARRDVLVEAEEVRGGRSGA